MSLSPRLRLLVALFLLVAVTFGAWALSQPPAPVAMVPSPSTVATTAPPAIVSVVASTSATQAAVRTDVDFAREFSATRAMETVEWLASPQQAGRRAGTEAADRTAVWIAAQFQDLGLIPAGDAGGYLQRFSIPFLDLAATPVLEVVGGNGEAVLRLQHRQDFREVISDQAGAGAVSGELVFVGAGEAADYRELDVNGKVALSTGSQTVAAAGQAASRGAKAILIVAADSARMRFRGSYLVPVRSTAIPCLLVARSAVTRILATRDFTLTSLTKPQRLGITVRASVTMQPMADRPAANVLGVIPGSDPAMKDKVVILSAHYDHLGVDPDGTFFPGANDDASGVAAMLETVRMFKTNGTQPRATILFASWTGEEAGLLGAIRYVRNPSFPLKDTLAMIQMDCIARGAGDRLSISKGGGRVAETLQKAAADLDVRSAIDPEEGGSDHVPFYQSGVPAALVIWADVLPVIHDPEDAPGLLDPDRLRSAGMVAVLATARLAGWQ